MVEFSPRFDDVYIDDFSINLSSCEIGCVFGSHVISHIPYADDLIMFCPSAKGLQSLTTNFQTYGDDYDIHFNLDKKGMLIQPKIQKYIVPVTFFGMEIIVDSCFLMCDYLYLYICYCFYLCIFVILYLIMYYGPRA